MKRNIQVASPAKQECPIALDEWDFHEIEPWEVEHAVTHEYARECLPLMDELAQHMTADWYAAWKNAELEKIAAEKAKDMRVFSQWYEKWREKWTEGAVRWSQLRGNYSAQLLEAMTTALKYGLDYRQPWLKQRECVASRCKRSQTVTDEPSLARLEEWPPRYKGDIGDVIVMVNEAKPDWELAYWWSYTGVARYVLHVSWDEVAKTPDGKRKLLQYLSAALEKARLKRSQTGKAAAKPFHLLRALAAWRWKVKADCSHDVARRHIRQRARELGLKYNARKKFSGFPDIADPDAWGEAIARAEVHLQSFLGELPPV
jgi:hypothetical protein